MMENKSILQEMAIEDGKNPEVIPVTLAEVVEENKELRKALKVAEEKLEEMKELKKTLESLKTENTTLTAENVSKSCDLWDAQDRENQLNKAVLAMALKIYAPEEE